MPVTCACEGGFCQRLQRPLPSNVFASCQRGNHAAVDAMQAAIDASRARIPKRQPRERRPMYGNRLATIIQRETGVSAKSRSDGACSGCTSDIADLNQMTAQQIGEQLDAIADRIVNRGRKHARTWLERMACRVSPVLVSRTVRGWIREAIETAVPEPESIWTSTTRHLTMHVWPTRWHNGWQWNLEQLAARASLFNGRKVLAVATDGKTWDADAVRQYAADRGLVFDEVVARRNSRSLREVYTWEPMLQALGMPHLAETDVVFSCHAKGVRHDNHGGHVQAWADLMYQSCLDYWPLVEHQLSQYVATGSFKRYGMFTTPRNKRWHYSGTFFWWRPAELAKRDWRRIDRRFFGTESWLGLHCFPDETGCLFLDGVGDLYQADYWENEVWPKWSSWKLEAESFRSVMAGST